MFKKFKDRLTEVSEEVKRDPRFVNSIASVNQLAQQTYSLAVNKAENRGSSRESLASDSSNIIPTFSQLQQQQQIEVLEGHSDQESGHRRSLSSDLQAYFSSTEPKIPTSSSSPSLVNSTAGSVMASAANNSFFSLTEEDDAVVTNSPDKKYFTQVDLSSSQQQQEAQDTLSPMHRSRRLSSGSMTTEAANLFPIYESPQQVFNFPDLDSTAGSEWDEDGGSSHQHLSAISKEQLFQMLQKARARYHKYKGRYSDVAKAYQDLERENGKIKTVMQQTQDKALRRISELKEQCQLEQKAKRHLEEELRSDLEEKQHVISALETKVTLLKSGGKSVIDENGGGGDEDLVDLTDPNENHEDRAGLIKRDSEKVASLEDKVKRLEGLLTKCKESIKANKQKTTALTEVKESLAKQVVEKEAELGELRSQFDNSKITLNSAQKEIEGHRKRAQQEELQIAEVKMMMHQEMITKDEEIGKLRTNLKHANESIDEKDVDIAKLKDNMDTLKEQQVALEKSLEKEKAMALQEISRGKASAVQALQTEQEKRIEDLNNAHEKDKNEVMIKIKEEMKEKLQLADREKQRALVLKDEEMIKKLEEKEEEGRLAKEELELRLSSMTNGEDSKSKLLNELESKLKTAFAEKKQLQSELSKLKEELNSVCSQIKVELSEELETLKSKHDGVQDELERTKEQLSKNKDNYEEERTKLEAEINVLKVSHQDVHDDKENTLVQVQFEKDQLSKTVQSQRDHISNVESTLKSIEEELEFQKQSFEKLEFENQKAVNENQEKHQIAMSLSQEKINELEIELQKVESTTELMNAEHKIQVSSIVKSHQMELETLKKDQLSMVESQNVQIDNLETEKRQLSMKVDELTKDHREELFKLNEKYKLENKELEKDIQSKQSDLDSITEAMNACNALIHDLQESNKKLLNANQENSKKSENFEKALQDERHKNLSAQHQLEQLQKSGKKTNELETEIIELKNREVSLKENEQKMISYQKELQDQINSFEVKEKLHLNEIDMLTQIIETKTNEINEMTSKNSAEIEALKVDLQLKIRHERDKENSYKELQVQSIEYQKKLQDQITAMEEEITSSKANHSNQVLQLSARVEELTAHLANSRKNLENKDNELKSINDSSNQEIQDLKHQNEELRERHDNLATTADQLEKELIKRNNNCQNDDDGKSAILELKEFKEKLEINNQMLYDAQNSSSAKESELEEVKTLLTTANEDIEALKKDLKSSQDDKATQLLEYEESLVKLEQEIKELRTKNQQLQEILEHQNRKMEEKKEENDLRSQIEKNHEDSIKMLIKKYETQLAEKEESSDMELERVRDQGEVELRKTVQEFQLQISDLKHELYEKTALYDDVMERHQFQLSAKQDELDQEVEACNRMYQAKIAEVQAEHEAKLQSLQAQAGGGLADNINDSSYHNSWNWERATSMDEEAVLELQRTPTREQREQQIRQTASAALQPQDDETSAPATLTVTSTTNQSYSIEDANEYEYLKNVLYQYMLGKEPITLARVLATVVKFSPDEINEVLKHEEKKHSIFSSLGLIQN